MSRGRVLKVDPATLFDERLESGVHDTIVSVHALCRVPDIDAALQRFDDLLAPGGKVLVLEHVRGSGLRGAMQDASTPMWRHVPFGCNPNRDPIAALRRNGFAVTDCDRFREPRSLPIVARYISAVAIRKAKPPVEEVNE